MCRNFDWDEDGVPYVDDLRGEIQDNGRSRWRQSAQLSWMLRVTDKICILAVSRNGGRRGGKEDSGHRCKYSIITI